MGGEIVGSAARRRRDEHAVADHLLESDHAVDEDAQLRGLARLSEDRDLVHRLQFDLRAAVEVGDHPQRMESRALRPPHPAEQILGRERVHQESDGAAVHAVDGRALRHEAVDRLEHEPVSAEGDDHVGVGGGFGLIERF